MNQALADGRTFSQAQVLNWTFQLLDVMEYLHGQRCVIGDLDASSVVLTPDNKRVCLVDFKYLTAIEERLRSRGKMDFGLYEETDGEALAEGIREDIRRLGRLMFELLTHETPDDAPPEEPLSNAAQKLSERGVSDSVAAVILRAMSQEPGEGYQSAAHMRRALQELPTQDKQASFQMFALAGGVLLTLAMFLIGAFSMWKGQYQSYRYLEMTLEAKSAEEARREGDYSAALSHALSATLSRDNNDTPCPPEAQSALADILSAYDYIPGYKPFWSFPLVGQPLNARISPDGTRIAVLAEDAAAYPATKRIQAFDAESGRELAQLTPGYSARSDFVFLDPDTILYAEANYVSAYSLWRQQTIFSAPMGSSDPSAPVGIALSADGKTAASMLWGGSEAYLYDVDAILNGEQGEPFRRVKIVDTGNAPVDSFIFASAASQTDSLLALSADGKYLALSFSNGGLGLYYLPDGQEPIYYELLDKSGYARFEGGFFRDYFFYAASTSDDLAALVPFQGALFRLDENRPEIKLRLNRSLPIHIQANEEGIYLSIGSSLYCADTDELRWRFLADTGSSIKLLRHAAGRLFAVTESGVALICREDGAWLSEIARGAFDVAGLSERYAFLAAKNAPTLSVFQWRENGSELLTYDEDYQKRYEHLDARIHSDGQTAMLFRSTGFRIYALESGERIDADSNWEETKFEREASVLIYQREPRLPDDPQKECLKVIGSNEVSFYSARTGEPLYYRERREGDFPIYFTQSYCVQQTRAAAPIQILQRRSNVLRKEIQENLLVSASQCGDYLILSLSTLERQRYSLILDQNLDVIAEVPEPCEALPGGTALPNGNAAPFETLIFDDMHGRLLQGSLYTLEDLRSLANYWGMDTG